MAQPRTGPCAPWAELDDVCDACAASTGEDELDDEVIERMLGIASDMLFVRSARRFPGVCTGTVRPCRRSSGNSAAWGGWGWQPSWGWCGCHRHPERGDCGCSSLSELTLGAEPIVDILEVRVDGAVLPETEYRVDDRRWLVRLDPEGDGWPCCQDLTANSVTDPDTFQVMFTYGIDPPAAGVLAAATLACEMALACAGSDSCRLPRRVQQITRDGVSMALLDPLTIFDEGRFGIPEVDMFLATYNPKKLQRRATVTSPHIRRPVRRVSDTGGS